MISLRFEVMVMSLFLLCHFFLLMMILLRFEGQVYRLGTKSFASFSLFFSYCVCLVYTSCSFASMLLSRIILLDFGTHKNRKLMVLEKSYHLIHAPLLLKQRKRVLIQIIEVQLQVRVHCQCCHWFSLSPLLLKVDTFFFVCFFNAVISASFSLIFVA